MSSETPTVHGGSYDGANLSCADDGCNGSVTVKVPNDTSPIIVQCTTCGKGARYEQFKQGTEIRGKR